MERLDSAQTSTPAASTQDGDRKVSTRHAPTTGAKMKAVVFHGKEDLRFEDVPEPKCGAGQVKVKPAWCGICGECRFFNLAWVLGLCLCVLVGTDLHEYLGGPSICPTDPHPLTGESVPLTLGHEFSGIIEELGEGVSDKFKVGDRVVVQPIIYDGDCGACQEGLINCCYKNGFLGLSG
jgi:threonine dehydrogenase-like Zn-dependent dehydrogenase